MDAYDTPSRGDDAFSVYLVDDDPAIVRYGVAVLGGAGYDVQGFTDVDEFLAACTPCRRGCILLDIHMPALSGPALQTLLRERGVCLPILFLTGRGDLATAVEVMRQGAVDVIEKPVTAGELVARVRRAIDADADDAVRRQTRATLLQRYRDLSARERSVCERIAGGEANKQVAIGLAISERTVEVHRARVMAKMQASSLADLVMMCALCRGTHAVAVPAPPTRLAVLR